MLPNRPLVSTPKHCEPHSLCTAHLSLLVPPIAPAAVQAGQIDDEDVAAEAADLQVACLLVWENCWERLLGTLRWQAVHLTCQSGMCLRLLSCAC